MKLNDRFDGTNDPFQGDRVLRLQNIPAGTRILHATATITPASAPGAVEPFTEVIDFLSVPPVTWGATRSTVQVPTAVAWSEIDFHARRTLASVEGVNIAGSRLQADFGGVYVEINDVGGVKIPNANNTDFPISASPASLPGLTVAKFKLTGPATALPTINRVRIRSAPTNLSLRFGQMPSFWTRVGEMTQTEMPPDFSLALQAFITDASPENGIYNIPLIVHSDSIARLQIDLSIEFIVEENALEGLNSISLPFDFSRASSDEANVLQITLPTNSRLSPSASRARVTGNFAETRIAYDPMEKVTSQAGSPVGTVKSVAPADKVRIAPGSIQAQPVSFNSEISATAIDLLLEVKETARLQLDLREDFDGKPGPASLLPKAVDFEVPGPAGLENSSAFAAVSKWISVVLPAEFQFKASTGETRRRYWIVAQSVAGEAQWSVAGAAAAPNLIERIGLQRSTEDGLSWREAAAPNVTGALTAFFRLRSKPDRFEMPIALQIGEGDQAVRVSLDRFAPTGSVNFDLDFDDVNKGLAAYTKMRALICREAEHVLNGDFEQWIGGAPSPTISQTPTDQPSEWTLTEGSVKRLPAGFIQKSVAALGLRMLPPASTNGSPGEIVQSALSQVTPVMGSCTYDFSFEGIASEEDAVAEIFWLGETCGAITPEPVLVPIKVLQVPNNNTSIVSTDTFLGFFTGGSTFTASRIPFALPLHRVRVVAPPEAQQAEIRFSVPDGVAALIDNVSLRSTSESVANGDFRVTQADKLDAWVSLSAAPLQIQKSADGRRAKFDNTQNSNLPIEIKQTIAVKPDEPFTLTIKKGETILQATPPVLPRVEVRWVKADGSNTAEPVVAELDPASFNSLSAIGTAPGDATHADIHFIVPPRTSQEIESISLGFPARTKIPVTFIAQSPGELTVSDWQVGFESEPEQRPPVPPRGLCTPTPIGSVPGESKDGDCFCKCCKSRQPVASAEIMQTDRGTPALVGRCANCGDTVISFGGRSVAGSTRLATGGSVTAQPILVISADRRSTEVSDSSIVVTQAQSIIDIKGIGKRFSEQLAEIGITSIESLAGASAERIAQVKGISETQAVSFITQAQSMLSAKS